MNEQEKNELKQELLRIFDAGVSFVEEGRLGDTTVKRLSCSVKAAKNLIKLGIDEVEKETLQTGLYVIFRYCSKLSQKGSFNPAQTAPTRTTIKAAALLIKLDKT